MAEGKITVNLSLNGPLDVERLAEEFKASIRKEIERVGVKVELASEYRKVTDRKPKAGDFVKFTQEFADDDEDITGGNYYEITNIDSDGHIVFYDDVSDIRYKCGEDGEVYKKVAPCCEEPLKEAEIKAGDYAKVISVCGGDVGGITEGSIVKVARISGGDFLNYETLDGNKNSMFLHRFVKATDEEVAEANRKQAEKVESEKWAKIGRKPNEFKKGDIVKDTDGTFGFHYREVLTAYSDYLRCTGGVDIHVQNAKLITPVEVRFDR